jgi:hypothetical protein
VTASEQSNSTNGGDQPKRVNLVELAQPVGPARVDEDALTAGALIRLAGALDTTVADRIRRIPVRGSSALHPVLDHLREAECLELLAPGGSGRVAFVLASRLSVMPVTFTLHDRRMAFRTGAASAIARYGDGPVAFEVDRLDEAAGEGWSVLISGKCTLQKWGADPWEDLDVLVVVEPEHISGRRIRTW